MLSSGLDNMRRKLRREAQLVSKLPINQAALRWIEQARKDNGHCDREVERVDTDAHVTAYIWCIQMKCVGA